MQTVRQLNKSEWDYWDTHIQRFKAVHPYHAFGWGQIKEDSGWHPVYLVVEQKGKILGAMMLIIKPFPWLGRSAVYRPEGLYGEKGDDRMLIRLLEAAKEISRTHRAIFLRIDPHVEESEEPDLSGLLKPLGFRYIEQRWSNWNAPCDELRVDLKPYKDSDHLFQSLKKRTRYQIRKADKEGIIIERATNLSQLKTFYKIFQEFSYDKGFFIRGFEHQEAIWRHYIARNMGRLFLARYKDEIIGGGTAIIFGKKYLGVHIGTSKKFRKLHTSYALTWKDIQCAKELDCDWFSFGGASSESQEYFKLKFLAKKVALLGYFDLPLDPILYRLAHDFEFSLLPKVVPYVKKVISLVK